jgi:hypothetical protein
MNNYLMHKFDVAFFVVMIALALSYLGWRWHHLKYLNEYICVGKSPGDYACGPRYYWQIGAFDEPISPTSGTDANFRKAPRAGTPRSH